jgi:hypothetical protein
LEFMNMYPLRFATLIVLLILSMVAARAAEIDGAAAYSQGLSALNKKQWDVAAEKLLASQKVSPSAMTCYLLADAYAHLNDYGKTYDYASTALSSTPPIEGPSQQGASMLLGWASAMMESSGHVSLAMSVPTISKDTGSPASVRGSLPQASLAAYDQAVQDLQTTDLCPYGSSINSACRMLQLLYGPNVPPVPAVVVPVP